MPTRTRKPGEFCWINIIAPQPDQARAFFGSLLGWTFKEMPGMGHFIQVGGQDIGGLFDLNGPQTPPGTPPGIGVMVKVDDAAATGARVAALGGKAKPPMDMGSQGRMVACQDPNGAQFDLWQHGMSPGTEVDGSLPGAPSWFETLTTDTARASDFYAKLFGWTPVAMPTPGIAYTSFKLGDTFVAGMMALTPEMGPLPPHWGTYFTVKDVDASAREAERLGATILVPPKEIPEVGRFCCVQSPQGVPFYLITYAR